MNFVIYNIRINVESFPSCTQFINGSLHCIFSRVHFNKQITLTFVSLAYVLQAAKTDVHLTDNSSWNREGVHSVDSACI